MISGCFPGWGLYLQRLSTGDTDTVSKSSAMLVKKPGGRDMKKYIWLRIILGSMKKYGFVYMENRPDTGGEDSRIYF